MSTKNLSVAYSAKRKVKKMAKGGELNTSASTEHRPSTQETDKDAKMVSKNDTIKAAINDSMTSTPERKQASKGMKTTPIKHPKMVPSTGFTAKLRDQEDDLQSSAGVNDGGQHQPSSEYDEEGADRQGPSTPSLKMKKMAEGGVIEATTEKRPSIDDEHNDKEEIDEVSTRSTQDISHQEHPMDDLSQFDHVADDDIIEHAASLASAVMAKRRMMAEGGEIKSASSVDDDSNTDVSDLSRNADEDANMEDQLSFNALRKENYSESEGLAQLDSPSDSNEHGHDMDDDHDMSIVDAVRRKMKTKSPITR